MKDPLDDFAGEVPADGHPNLLRLIAFFALLLFVLSSCDLLLL
jgi:hypothetical protein